jgi:hypothetical protein
MIFATTPLSPMLAPPPLSAAAAASRHAAAPLSAHILRRQTDIFMRGFRHC